MMKIGSAALLSAFLMVGCSSKEEAAPASADNVVDVKYAGMIHVENVTVEKLHHAIMAAGEAEGWKMTEFKGNEVIAEKFGDDEVTAIIKFDRYGYEVHSESDTDDLEDAIKEQLEAKSSH